MSKNPADKAISLPTQIEEVLPDIQAILEAAQLDTAKFVRLGKENKTTKENVSFSDLCKWLEDADDFQQATSHRALWSGKQRWEKFGLGDIEKAVKQGEDIEFNRKQDIFDALQLVAEIKRIKSLSDKPVKLRKTEDKKRRVVGRVIEINGVKAIEWDVKQSENLQDPIVDVALRVNNPIGRLWAAIKKIWKKQNTIIALKFTIPLLVLPIVIFVLWRVWQGRGVNVPVSKLGVIHQVRVGGDYKDTLILPTSDVYMLSYGDFSQTRKVLEKPVVVIGMYNNLTNTLEVEDLIAYNEADIPISAVSSQPSTVPSIWSSIWSFLNRFR